MIAAKIFSPLSVLYMPALPKTRFADLNLFLCSVLIFGIVFHTGNRRTRKLVATIVEFVVRVPFHFVKRYLVQSGQTKQFLPQIHVRNGFFVRLFPAVFCQKTSQPFKNAFTV